MPEHPYRQLTEPSAPDVIYDRAVHTTAYLPEPDRLLVKASLLDDTYGPAGFQTIHRMELRADVALPEATITAVESNMDRHPHAWCPGTESHLDRIVGLQIGAGFFSSLRAELGGKRSCNHLHTLAQTIGTVVALSYAARTSFLDPSVRALADDEFFEGLLARHGNVVDSCHVWRSDGPLIAHVSAPTSKRRR